MYQPTGSEETAGYRAWRVGADRGVIQIRRYAHGVPRWVVAPRPTALSNGEAMLRRAQSDRGAEGWQRNYWDHVIRDNAEHDRIAQYIRDNPAKWKGDRFNR